MYEDRLPYCYDDITEMGGVARFKVYPLSRWFLP